MVCSVMLMHMNIYHSPTQLYLLMQMSAVYCVCCVLQEVGGWYPPAPTAAELAVLPPVLALGGAVDRIIRPFQVRRCWASAVVK